MKLKPNFTTHTWQEYYATLVETNGIAIPILGYERPYLASEKSLQRACAKVLDYLRFHWVHPPNEGARTVEGGASLKAQGMKPGAVDIIILQPAYTSDKANYWNHIAIELKTKNNTVSEAQTAFLLASKKSGAGAFVCYNYEAFEAVLRYCFPDKFKN